MDEFETPANYTEAGDRISPRHSVVSCLTNLELACPEVGWWVVNKPFGEVALYSTNKIMTVAVFAFGDRSESVVFHDCRSRDTGQQALLETPLETDDRNFG